MTVAKLIEELRQMPQSYKVIYHGYDCQREESYEVDVYHIVEDHADAKVNLY